MLIRSAHNRGDIGDMGLAVLGVLILIAVIYFLSRIGLPSVPKDAEGKFDLSGHPNLSGIFLRYDGDDRGGMYIDDMLEKALTDDEVRERLADPPGPFERHYRISEFLAVFIIIMGAAGGAGAGGAVITSQFFDSGGGFSGYSRSYVPGGGGGGGVNPMGCGVVFVLVFLLVGYYWHFSSPGVARGWGAIIDFCLRFLWWCCKFCQGDI